MRYGALLIAALVVLSGCSGLGGGGTPTDDAGSTPTPTEATATPTPSPTPTPTGELPPGVGPDGIENVTALSRAHAAALNGTGFRSALVLRTALLDSELGLNATQRFETAVAEGGVPYRRYRNNSGGLSEDFEATTWGNGSVEATRRTSYPPFDNATTSYEVRSEPAAPLTTPGTNLLFYLRLGSFDVVRDGDRIRLEATGPNASSELNVTSFEGTVVLDRQGRLRSGDIALNLTTERGSFRARLTYELSTDPATVDRPDWVATALRSASTTPTGGLATPAAGSGLPTSTVGASPGPATAVVAARAG